MVQLFCFGHGYVAQHFTTQYSTFAVRGTKQSAESTTESNLIFNQLQQPDPKILDQYTHFLISIPPQQGTDIVLNYYADYFKNRDSSVKWIGYLSATNVYGNHAGAWVDETTPPIPLSERGRQRLKIENDWLSLYETHQCPVHIFRLSSIYGPHRSSFDRIAHSFPLLVDKPGHFFSRMHVADICQVLHASMDRPNPGQIYNLSDDLPAENATVMEYAYSLLNQPPPARIPYNQAPISDGMRDYYLENKRVKNDKIKQELGICLLYPTYKEGLNDCFTHFNNEP